jgi:hypothetical protein
MKSGFVQTPRWTEDKGYQSEGWQESKLNPGGLASGLVFLQDRE